MRTLSWISLAAVLLGLAYYYGSLSQRGPATPGQAVTATGKLHAPPVTSPGLSTPPRQSDAADLTGQLQELLLQSQYDLAIELYESAEHDDPTVFAALKAVYREYLEQLIKGEDYSAVVAAAQVFRDAYYNDFYTLVYLAAACSHLGDYRCTIDAYYAAVLYGIEQRESGLARRNLNLYLDKTDTLWSAGQRWQELVALYQHALQWEPDHAGYYLRLAELHLELGDSSSTESYLASVDAIPEYQQRIDRLQQAIADQSPPVAGIPLGKKGSHYLVDVMLNGVPARLMIDTGASVSALSRRAARSLVDTARLQHQGDTELATAGGNIPSPVYLADTVAIDRHRLYGVEWVVIDYPDDSIDGVLGMNILSQFEFQLDQQHQVLILHPR